jgi:membrane protease YdiL (CAAX protease family)
MSLMRRHPLISSFVLAYALSWWIWILYAFAIAFLGPIFALGPFLAAIIVTALTGGKTGVVGLLSRMVRWRVGLRWYAAALGLPVAVYLFAVSLNMLSGASASTAQQFGSWYLIFPLFAYSLLFPLSGAFGEELGWRGYALPRVQARLSALSAALIIGVIQTAWHLPLFMTDRSTPPVPLIVGYMGLGILATWVFNNTAGSVLMTMVLHASFNTNAAFFGEMFAGADLMRMSWLLAALWCAAAVVVVIVCGPAHSRL